MPIITNQQLTPSLTGTQHIKTMNEKHAHANYACESCGRTYMQCRCSYPGKPTVKKGFCSACKCKDDSMRDKEASVKDVNPSCGSGNDVSSSRGRVSAIRKCASGRDLGKTSVPVFSTLDVKSYTATLSDNFSAFLGEKAALTIPPRPLQQPPTGFLQRAPVNPLAPGYSPLANNQQQPNAAMVPSAGRGRPAGPSAGNVGVPVQGGVPGQPSAVAQLGEQSGTSDGKGFGNTPTQATSSKGQSSGGSAKSANTKGVTMSKKKANALMGRGANKPMGANMMGKAGPGLSPMGAGMGGAGMPPVKTTMPMSQAMPMSMPQNLGMKAASIRVQLNSMQKSALTPMVNDPGKVMNGLDAMAESTHPGLAHLGLAAGSGVMGGTIGAMVGAPMGGLVGMGRGNTAEGLGRGALRGAATGAGMGIGGSLGLAAGSLSNTTTGSVLGNLLGSAAGGAAGYMGSGKLLGPARGGHHHHNKETDMAKAEEKKDGAGV